MSYLSSYIHFTTAVLFITDFTILTTPNEYIREYI